MSPLLSLVTGKVERDASFQRLVKSIVENTSVEWELVIADASAVPYVPAVPNITVIHENPRKTHSQGYNAAFRLAKGTWCIWLNDDAEVCPRYDVEAIRFMESHPTIGLGALHYSENGGPFHVNGAWQTMYANFGILSKSIGEKVGWFDQAIGMYGADNSLAIKILLAGHGIADIPAARILHHSSKDQIRAENQLSRNRDNKILSDAYMASRNYWQRTYRQHQHHCTAVPWSHGVAPQLAGVR